MKTKIIYRLFLLGIWNLGLGAWNFSSAQSPQGINYQAVARDASGNPLVGASVALRFSIYRSVPLDTAWVETQTKTTNQFGLFMAVIGQGTKIGGSASVFSNINWASGNFYLRVWVNNSDMGFTQFFTVPYSSYADSAGKAPGLLPAGTSGQTLRHNGTNWISNSNLFNNGTNVGIGTTAPNTVLDINGAFSVRGMTAPGPALSPATEGRIYFDNIANKFKVSENGTAYVDLLPAGTPLWSRIAPNTYLTNNGDSVGIGTLLPTAKLHIVKTGGGNAFYSANSGSGNAVYGYNTGTGRAGQFQIANLSNANSALFATTNGTGGAGFFSIGNALNAGNALLATTNGSGNAVYGYNTGTGRAGYFETTNAASTQDVIYSTTNGSGPAVHGENTGTGAAGNFQITNAANTVTALTAGTAGGGPAIYAYTTGADKAGFFQISNAASTSPALFANTNSPTGLAGEFVGKIRINDGSAAANKVLVATDGLGTAQWQTLPAGVAGSGTLNYVSKFTPNGTTLGNSKIFDDGTNVGIGTGTPISLLHISGTSDPLQVILQNGGGNFKTGYTIKTALNEWFIGQEQTSASGFRITDVDALAVRLQIDELTGNVGIGTTSPGNRLHVSGGAIDVDLSGSYKVGNEIVLTRNASEVSVGSNFVLPLILRAGLEKMRILTNGNVGIGTTAPSAKLNVEGVGSLTEVFRVSNDRDAAKDSVMVFTSAGKVGIGTTTPTAKLDIIPSTGAALNIQPFGGVAGQTGELRFYETIVNGDYVGFKAPDFIAPSTIWTLPAADGLGGSVLTTNGSGILSWGTVPGMLSGGTINYIPKWTSATSLSSTSLLYENGTNVGIGTVTPTTKLEVSGGLKVTGGLNTDKDITLRGGNNSATAIGGDISIIGGNGYNMRGGNITIEAGFTSCWAGAGVSSDVFIKGGLQSSAPTDVRAQIQVGGGKVITSAPCDDTHGGTLTLSGGNAFGTNRNGGHIILLPGTPTGSGTTGNVGIGTTAPGEKLEVNNGNVKITGTGTGNPLVVRSPVDGYGLKVRESDDGFDAVALFGYATRGRILVNNGITTTVNIDADPSISSYFNAGNVGIGTTTPISTLKVNGSMAGNFINPAAANYICNAKDYFVHVTMGGGTITLPLANSVDAGNVIIIRNNTGANITVNTIAGDLIYFFQATIGYVAGGSAGGPIVGGAVSPNFPARRFISDGVNKWIEW